MRDQAALDQLALSQDVERTSLGREVGIHSRALAALNAVAATASMTLDVAEVLRLALAQALEVVGVEAGAISVLDEDTSELVFRVQQGWRVHDFVSQGVRVPADQGLSGLAVSTGQPVVTGDVRNDPRVAVSEFRDEPVQAMALAPMRARGRVVGVLGVMSYTPYRFSPDEVTFISAIADQIGVAFDNACLFEEARCRVKELSTLQAISTQVASTFDLWAVLETIVSSTVELIDAVAAAIYLYEGESDKLAFATALGKDDSRARSRDPLPDTGPVAQAARTGNKVVLEDLASQAGAGVWQASGMQALLALPLKRATRVLGVLAIVFDAPRSFSDHELRIAELLAEQAAIAIERTRLFAGETRRSTQLALINQVARQATATLNLNEILDVAAVSIRRGFGYFNIALFLVDRAAEQVELCSIAGGHTIVMRRGYRQSIGEGIVGWVAKTGETLLVNDIAQEPRYRPISPTIKPVGSELAVPIVRGDEVIGVLDIRNLERGAFGQDDVEAMEALADQLAIAIDNARLYEETQRRVAELTAIQETNLRVVSELDTPQVLHAVARNVIELGDADDVYIFLHNPADGSLSFGTALWRSEPSAVSVQKQPDRFTRAVLNSSRSLVINHAREHPYFALPEKKSLVESQRASVEAIAGFPLLGTAGVVGVMVVTYLRPHIFGTDELRTLGLLASQAAVAITNARLYGETRQRLEELTMLHAVALAAASTLSVEEIAESVIAVVEQGLGFEHQKLYLVEEKHGMLELVGRNAEAQGGLSKLPVGQGLVGWVAECGIGLRIDDVSQDARYLQTIPGIRSALVVPLAVGGRVIGVLQALSSYSGAFSADDERLFTTVARQLAVAIENARLYQETERRLAEVSMLYQLARQVNTSLDVQERLNSIVESLKQAMGCRACSIALLDPINDVLEIRAAAGIKGKWQSDFKLGLGEGVAGRVALEGAPMYVSDTLEMESFIFFDPSVRSLLTVPLSVQGRIIGTLSVDSETPDAFSTEDERLLAIAAAQAAIAIENARLYTSLEQRARNLAEAYAELQEVDRLRDEMVQNVSHELRTPLTFVKGYVELLLAGDAGPLTDLQKEYLDVVIGKTDTVTHLVSDIMFLQQADQLPKKTSVSLAKLARRALQGCAATAEQAGLTLVEDIPGDLPPVAGDAGRLQQVFDNLLGNAIKFSPDGGRITVAVRDVGELLQVSVSDEGVGIPEDQHERIFERFYQVDGSARRHFAGVGLGLTIAKRIVEAHGGRIWVESVPDKGSTFYFTIPKYQAEEQALATDKTVA
ncbi:MAG: GAF domain-containing protein [Anaerolineae bacterium]|nr:GAF domain-containing protein [Anaerolineae bacterium]